MNSYLALVLASVVAFAVTAALGFLFIPWLHKLKFGQTILDIGPNWHKKKQGTPTMGGIMFIIGITAAITAVLVADRLLDGNVVGGMKDWEYNPAMTKLISGVIMALCFGLIGFADDYIKVVKKRNLGLTIMQKTLAQVVVCLAYLASLYMAMNGRPYMFVPFIGAVNLSWFFWIFGFAAVYATVNAVNFTDGIDGLCSSVTVSVAVTMCAIAILRGLFGMGIIAAALAGGCLGFLVWNRNPAKVFMGDTGSMFLGGLVVAVAFGLDCPLIILPVGIIYVIEMLSDVIQIGYFKATGGKRIFKMAPIHHHFEMSGWKEKKIVAVFTLVNVIGCAVGFALMWFGGYRI